MRQVRPLRPSPVRSSVVPRLPRVRRHPSPRLLLPPRLVYRPTTLHALQQPPRRRRSRTPPQPLIPAVRLRRPPRNSSRRDITAAGTRWSETGAQGPSHGRNAGEDLGNALRGGRGAPRSDAPPPRGNLCPHPPARRAARRPAFGLAARAVLSLPLPPSQLGARHVEGQERSSRASAPPPAVLSPPLRCAPARKSLIRQGSSDNKRYRRLSRGGEMALLGGVIIGSPPAAPEGDIAGPEPTVPQGRAHGRTTPQRGASAFLRRPHERPGFRRQCACGELAGRGRGEDGRHERRLAGAPGRAARRGLGASPLSLARPRRARCWPATRSRLDTLAILAYLLHRGGLHAGIPE